MTDSNGSSSHHEIDYMALDVHLSGRSLLYGLQTSMFFPI